jgi:hypothetical protein
MSSPFPLPPGWADFASFFWGLSHPHAVVVVLLDNSTGLLLKVWSGFILSTTDFDTGRDFTSNATVARYEPAAQIVADAALVLIAIWASFRLMWSQGIRSQYSVRILLPRLMMGGLLINFSMPLFQIVVDASNTVSHAVETLVVFADPTTWWSGFAQDPSTGFWDILTTAALVAGYDALAIWYVVRYAILIALAVTAPIAGLLFVLPETHHLSKQWAALFTTNLFMQPVQLFVLAIGLALEHDGSSPVHHLFALASLFIVYKVPRALGGAEKAARQLQSTIALAYQHLGHVVVKA